MKGTSPPTEHLYKAKTSRGLVLMEAIAKTACLYSCIIKILREHEGFYHYAGLLVNLYDTICCEKFDDLPLFPLSGSTKQDGILIIC